MKKIYTLLLMISICCNALCQNWSTMLPFPGTSASTRFGGVSVSVGNKAYVGLGLSSSGGYQFFKDFWQYDVVSKVWTQLSDFPGSARYDAVAFVIGTDIYVGTGDISAKSAELNSGVYTKDFYKYNTVTGVWSAIPDFPENRGEAVAFTVNGIGYVSCGRNGDGAKKDLHKFDPATSSWTKLTDLPSSARSYPIGFSINGKGYVGGGYTGGWSFVGDGYTPAFFNDFWQYDPSTDQWVNKGTTYNGIAGGGYISEAITVSSCERAYVIGGRYSSDYFFPNCCSSVVSEYNPADNSWSQRTSFPQTIEQGSGWLINGVLYAGLGKANLYSLKLNDITGSSILCSSNQYLLSTLPNSSVTWQASPSNLFAVSSGSGTDVTLAPASGSSVGQGTLTFTIDNSCGSPVIVQQPISVYGSAPMPTGIDGPNYNLCRIRGQNNGSGDFYVHDPQPGVTYQFQVVKSNGQAEPVMTANFITLEGFRYAVGTHTLRLRSQVCGLTSSWYNSSFVVVNCPSGFAMSVSPNPASSELNVSFEEEGMQQTTLKEAYEVTLVNSGQEKVYSIKTTNVKVKIPTNALPEGIYFLNVTGKEGTIQRRILINH